MNEQTTNFMNQSNHIANYLRQALTALAFLLGLVGTASLNAQGWERFIGGSDFDEIFDIVQTRDQGFLATGYARRQ